MDKAYPPEAWTRLGAELEKRRGQLGYGFRRREDFLRDRGGPPPSVKTIARLERGERYFYPPATITRLEALYDYPPGTFEMILQGKQAEGDPEREDIEDGPRDTEQDAIIAAVRRLYPGDNVAEAIMAQTGKPLETRQRELDQWRMLNQQERDRNSR